MSTSDREVEAALPKSASGHDLPWRGYKLSEVLPILQQIASEEWTWCRKTQAKYITLTMDTRDGGFVRIMNRDGNLLTIDELRYQYSAAQRVREEQANGE